MSDQTTSLGINYSPNINDVYVINKEDDISGYYQSGNFPSSNYSNKRSQNLRKEQYYSSRGHPNFAVSSIYPNDQYNVHMNENINQPRIRQMNSHITGTQMMSNNGKLVMSPGNRLPNNNGYVQYQYTNSSNYQQR